MNNNSIEQIQTKIYRIRSVMVMLDNDIAGIYGVETKRINEAVKNNPEKFPDDFYFTLTKDEEKILKSKISTSSWGGRRTLPKVFTEQGVYMLATILKSKLAGELTVSIMRAFVKLRQFSLTYSDIINNLNDISEKVDEHDKTIKIVIKSLSELLNETQTNSTRKIGFLIDE